MTNSSFCWKYQLQTMIYACYICSLFYKNIYWLKLSVLCHQLCRLIANYKSVKLPLDYIKFKNNMLVNNNLVVVYAYCLFSNRNILIMLTHKKQYVLASVKVSCLFFQTSIRIKLVFSKIKQTNLFILKSFSLF